jgi:tRNA (guanine37-N1)-methyltransferase
MLRFDILSIFPEMFKSPFDASLLKKARDKGIIDLHLHNIRDYAQDKHHMTDDAPYGGGGGMIMKVEPIERALSAVITDRERALIILMTPQGEPFEQKTAEALASYEQIVVVCGHYEGLDERIRQYLVDREISIGDYILTGGELAAMVLVDAVSRLVPGVLGNSDSAACDSFSTAILEYPQYTRPAEYKGWRVPDVLLSGNHKEIDLWRRKASLRRTWLRRPDLLAKKGLSDEEKNILEDVSS